MTKYITGYCPDLDKETEIEVGYIGYQTLESDGKTFYTKNIMRCDRRRYGECKQPSCQIYESAPERF